MTTETHTQAGLVASAGVARLGAVTLAACPTGITAAPTYGALAVHQVSGNHPSSWTHGAIAKPATFMVFDRKNRPTRPLSELSP